MRRTNYRNIGIREKTKTELDELKKKLNEEYLSGATYDDLITIFLQKHKRLTLTSAEIKTLVAQLRGVKW